MRRKPQHIYFGTVMLWSVAVFCHAFFYVNSVLSGPFGPDLYANTVSFQIFVFMAGYFPGWFLLLSAMLVVEFAIMRYISDHTSEKVAAETDGK